MDNNQIYLREAGVNTAILNVIKEHLMNPKILNAAMASLFALSLDENNRSILIYNGSCETIIDVIEYHKSNIELLKNCCKVLILFLNNEDGVLCIKRKLSTLNNDDKSMITNMIKDICKEES
jgi:hypothetical protein